jgi:predicted nucleic acid-binding protein
VKVAFDTSVIVPAVISAHPRHTFAFPWLDQAAQGRFEGVVSWHAFAEAWSVLTRIRFGAILSGESARLVIERIESIMTPCALGADEYREAIARCARLGLSSGAVFDALHLVSAEKAEADLLVTFNLSDFSRMALPSGPRLLEPFHPPDAVLRDSSQSS